MGPARGLAQPMHVSILHTKTCTFAELLLLLWKSYTRYTNKTKNVHKVYR